MDEGMVRAAKGFVDAKQQRDAFTDECNVLETSFKQEISSTVDALAMFTEVTPAARLPDGRLVRNIRTESVRVINEARLRNTFGNISESDVTKNGGVFNAVVHELRNQCLSISENVKVTKKTEGLPANAFPIPAAPEEIQMMCAGLDRAHEGLRQVRKHKRNGKKPAEQKMSAYASAVESTFMPSPSEGLPPPIVITKPPAVTLPGENDPTPLPSLPVAETIAEEEEVEPSSTKQVVESDLVDSDIKVRMVETTRKGRAPTLKQFSGTLNKLLKKTTNYNQFNAKREELVEKAVEQLNVFRDAGTHKSAKIKIGHK
jgi:hypothetical protein